MGWFSGFFGWRSSSKSVVSNPFLFFGRVLLFFALSYLIWVPISPFYTKALSTVSKEAVFFTELSAPSSHNKVTYLKSKNSDIIVSYSKPEPKGTSLKLEGKQIHMNMVLLIALVLASPRLNISKRLKLLLLAIGTLFFVHVLLTIFVVKFYSAQILDSHSNELNNGIMQNIYYWGKTFYEGVGWQFFPFFIWAILCYKTFFFKEEATKSKIKEKIDRNAPCPCGSGRKYKRCCGRKSPFIAHSS